MWEYKVDHISNDVSKLEAKQEAKVITDVSFLVNTNIQLLKITFSWDYIGIYFQLYRKHQNYLHSLVGSEFETLPDNVFRMVAFGEIVSAQSFNYDDLHIEYFVDLPQDWSCDPSELFIQQ